MSTKNENFYEQRTFCLPRSSKVTEGIIQQLDHVLDFAAPEDYRETLIEIYQCYIIREHNMLPANFKQMATHLPILLEFFKILNKEIKVVRTEIN